MKQINIFNSDGNIVMQLMVNKYKYVRARVFYDDLKDWCEIEEPDLEFLSKPYQELSSRQQDLFSILIARCNS